MRSFSALLSFHFPLLPSSFYTYFAAFFEISYGKCVFVFDKLPIFRYTIMYNRKNSLNAVLKSAKGMVTDMRIVVKVGTSTLAHTTGMLNIRRTQELCRVLSDLKNAGHEVILVSSGAIGMGIGKLGLKEKPKDIPTKQAAAAVGQCELMYTYDRLFTEYHHNVAQILLTGADFAAEDRHENFTNTMSRLLELGVLPVINENDTVATEEIKVGDNDTLSAYVAVSAKADLLVILSDVNGLYDKDPHKNTDAKLIERVHGSPESLLDVASGAGSALGTGGMKTKLKAAKIARDAGCDTVIANGENPELLYDIAAGKEGGYTRFFAR